MDEKGRALQGRLDFFEHNVKILQTGVKQVLKSHEGMWQSVLALCCMALLTPVSLSQVMCLTFFQMECIRLWSYQRRSEK